MRKRILVVDDDPTLGAAMVRVLSKSLDADVEWRDRNRTASEYLDTCVPDLIVCDLNRPEGRGSELIRFVRESRRLHEVPIFICSGSLFEDGFDEDVFKYRIDAALRKPQTIAVIVETAARCMGRDPASALVNIGAESRTLDLKRDVDLKDKKQRASLAKDVLAFANSGGGNIVIGVDEPSRGVFLPVGVSQARIAELEVTRLNQALERYVGPTPRVESRTIESKGLQFVLLTIKASRATLVFAREAHEGAGLYPGRIYVRDDAARSTELQDSEQLSQTIERLVRERIADAADRTRSS